MSTFKRPKFPTEERKNKIRQILSMRQPDLTLVLNNIHDPHNVSAIYRSCDAFGILGIHLYYPTEKFPVLGKKSSASAKKWMTTTRHSCGTQMVTELRESGKKILCTGFGPHARPVNEWDLTTPTAIIMGNEHRGVDPEFEKIVDGHLFIPMAGMVQSLNVSVASAIILYEAWRQRQAKNMYDTPAIDPEILETLFEEWCQK